MYFLFNWFVKITGWIPYHLIFRPKIYFENKEIQGRNIKGKAIVASNHYSVWDFGVLLFLFPLRTLRCVTAELMYEKNFFMTAFLKLAGTIKVDRTTHDFMFLSNCEKVLKKGGVVEIYPESRVPDPGEETPLPFKTSAVYLALESNTPIIPVYTNGEQFSKKRMKIMIGTPIDVVEMVDAGLTEKENIANITEYLRRKIIEFQERIKAEETGR